MQKELEILCLKNIIGLKGSCDCNNPTSGLYINSLPGINLKKLVAAAGEKTRGETLFKDLYNEAVLELVAIFRSKLCDHFAFNQIVAKKRIGRIGRDFPVMPIQKGIRIERWHDDIYKCLKVETIAFRSNNAGVAKMWIKTIEGTEEREINVVKGKNVLRLDIETTEELSIYLDPAIWIADKNYASSCGCNDYCECETDYSCGNMVIRLMECVDGKWRYGGQGIEVNAYIKNDDTDLLCEFSSDFALALRMLIGIKLMEIVLGSESVNPMIRNTKADAERLVTMWRGGINSITGFEEKSQFWPLIMPVIKRAERYLENLEGNLVHCDGNVLYSEVIP